MKWKKVISFLLQNKEIDDIKPLLSTEELTRFENSNIRTALDLYLLKSIHFCILKIFWKTIILFYETYYLFTKTYFKFL